MVIAGIEPVHFANEVFSWHSINGEDGEKLLPAVMISTLTPAYFTSIITNEEWQTK